MTAELAASGPGRARPRPPTPPERPPAESETAWLARVIRRRVTTRLAVMSPSAWAETKRYLPPSATSLPGYYRFDVAPYMREITDCLGPESDVRHVSLMKGVQVGATTVLENVIGYYIDVVKTASMMLVTADAELAKLRIEGFVVPMLQYSGLAHLVRSNDEHNSRKTGRTDKRYEWEGGGSLVPFGAVNANKLRSLPIQVLLRDEVDGWPDNVGKDGDPVKLSEDRTAAFEGSRKIYDCSTPLLEGTSKIARLYQSGDQRKYFVGCLACGHRQPLRWRVSGDVGQRGGMVWQTRDGRLVEGSARYKCEACGHLHSNADKPRLFAPDNAEWRPTAEPARAHHRSYHLSALYSPVGMQSWDACVVKWIEAWDDDNNRPRDNLKLQVFYNNVLGEPFATRGSRLRLDTVSTHRRHAYRFGEVPNRWAAEFCGSPVLLVTCAVDVHADNLAVEVVGWTRGRRKFTIDYWRFVGEVESLDDPHTWGRLRTLVEQREYEADDGRRYRIQMTLIDASYLPDHVYQFCDRYDAGVFPVRGRDTPPKGATLKEFWPYETEHGLRGWSACVDLYKERWASSLRRAWDGLSLQPELHFNAPLDATDAQLKELTAETRRERIDEASGRSLGFVWHRPSGAANEWWDLTIYNNVALDIIAFDVCINQLGLEQVDWDRFWTEIAA